MSLEANALPLKCTYVGCWLLVVGCWLLVVGCWLLVVGCWLLVVGCWLEGNLFTLPKESRFRLFISFLKKPGFLRLTLEWCQKIGIMYIYH
jgi:hypothetical protein